MQRRVDARGSGAEAFRETCRAASQSKLQVRGMDLTWRGRMVRHPCVGGNGQITDDADHFVPAGHIRAVQPSAVHRTDVAETVAERITAGSDGVGEVAVDDHRIGRRRDVRRSETAAGKGRHLIHLEK
jgi:hypothetical protein